MRLNPPQRDRYDWEKEWPSQVWSIGLDRLDLLGVDGKGQLYWNGHQIEIRQPLSLTFWQRAGAVIIVISSAATAIATAVLAYAALTTLH